MDYANHSLSVDETIVYPNQTGVALENLALAVEPNRSAGGFNLDSLTVNGLPATEQTLTGGRLEVQLAEGLAPNKAITLIMHYDLNLPYASSSQVYGYNGLQMNLLNWYPFVVPYEAGQGWVLHEPTSVGEHLVYDVADFDVTLQLADPTTAIVVAASAPAETTETGWSYRLTARTFVLSLSPDYLTSSTMVGQVTVLSYYFSGESSGGDGILQEVAKAITTYSDHFAPYPYTTLSIVEAIYADGMEADGLFFLSRKFYQQYDGTVRNNLITIGVHETAHEWWFGLVGNDQAMEPWLDEAMATYSEHIFYETNYPSYVNWWWGFRVNAFDPTGWVDVDIYNGGSFRSYTNAAYFRGAQFLEAIRKRIGDEAFFAFLRDYASQMTGRRATADDFFNILRQHTDIDFSDQVARYFQTPH